LDQSFEALGWGSTLPQAHRAARPLLCAALPACGEPSPFLSSNQGTPEDVDAALAALSAETFAEAIPGQLSSAGSPV